MKKIIYRATLSFALILLSFSSLEVHAETISVYMEEGHEFFKMKDFERAIKSWLKALEMDPLNEEVINLISDARFQADYHDVILKRLDQEEHLKTPYANELSDMAREMMGLLQEVNTKVDLQQNEALSLVSEEEIREALDQQRWYLQSVFQQGLKFYQDEDFESAFREWEKITPLISEEDVLSQTIEGLKFRLSERQRTPLIAVIENMPTLEETQLDEGITNPAVSSVKLRQAVFGSQQTIFAGAGASLLALLLISLAAWRRFKRSPVGESSFKPSQQVQQSPVIDTDMTFQPRQLSEHVTRFKKQKRKSKSVERELMA